jgi:hypothetical protein
MLSICILLLIIIIFIYKNNNIEHFGSDNAAVAIQMASNRHRSCDTEPSESQKNGLTVGSDIHHVPYLNCSPFDIARKDEDPFYDLVNPRSIFGFPYNRSPPII